MFDLITLSGLYLFTAGTAFILYKMGRWPGGIYHFWMWTIGVSLTVLAFEAHTYLHWPLWICLVPVPITGFIIDTFFLKNTPMKITITKMVSQSGKGNPLALQTKFEGWCVVASYIIGAFFFGVHLGPW